MQQSQLLSTSHLLKVSALNKRIHMKHAAFCADRLNLRHCEGLHADLQKLVSKSHKPPA